MKTPTLTRDEIANATVQTLLAHALLSPINTSTSDFNFDMEQRAGGLAHQAYQMADAMIYAREQQTHMQQ